MIFDYVTYSAVHPFFFLLPLDDDIKEHFGECSVPAAGTGLSTTEDRMRVPFWVGGFTFLFLNCLYDRPALWPSAPSLDAPSSSSGLRCRVFACPLFHLACLRNQAANLLFQTWSWPSLQDSPCAHTP